LRVAGTAHSAVGHLVEEDESAQQGCGVERNPPGTEEPASGE
jgi:hypothetical protein